MVRMQPDIIAIGEPMFELCAEQEGHLTEVKSFKAGWGGDTSNFSVAASRSGASVGYLTRLGNDPFGQGFLTLCRQEGIDCSRIVMDHHAFTAAYFISRKGKEHHFTYFRKGSAASRMTPDFLPGDYIASARLLHVSGISQAISSIAAETVAGAILLAKAAGKMVSYDPNFRPGLWPLEQAREVVHHTCRHADVIFPSVEDGRQLTDLDTPEEIARFYLGLGPKLVIVKLGAEGALLASADGLRTFAPHQVDAVDMSGAGDTFAGAFAARLLAGFPLEACVRFANAAAAITTTGIGCITPIPRVDEIEAFLSKHPGTG